MCSEVIRDGATGNASTENESAAVENASTEIRRAILNLKFHSLQL